MTRLPVTMRSADALQASSHPQDPRDGSGRLHARLDAAAGESTQPQTGPAFAGWNSCDCSPHLRGAVAVYSDPPESPLPDAGRVECGPAFGTAAGPATADGQWPTFRADQRRSAFTPAALGSKLEPVATIPAAAVRSAAPGTVADDWRLDGRGGVLTAPVMAEGTLLAAARHDRRLAAMTCWSRTGRASRCTCTTSPSIPPS